MTTFTPRSILSGRVKAGHGRDLDTAIAAASVVLGTPQLACISSRVGDNIWYLCAPAADLASHTQSSSPLAAALPGAPGHQGDGAYTLDLAENLQAVLVKQKNSLSSFVGNPVMVQRFITLEGLKESFSCPGDGLPWRFAHDAVVRRDGRLQNFITLSALLVTVVACGTWLWAAYQRPSQETLRDQLQREHKAALATAARAMTPPAYPPALEHLNKAVSQTITSGGALVQFEHKNGRSDWSLNVDNQIVTETAGAGATP
jgi:hypothetical protein